MNIDMFPKVSMVQLAWARVPAGRTESTNTIRLYSQQSSDYVAKCSENMSCLRNTKTVQNNHGGRPSPVYERISIAGTICKDCPLVLRCIIRDLANDADNWRFVPIGLQGYEYFF